MTAKNRLKKLEGSSPDVTYRLVMYSSKNTLFGRALIFHPKKKKGDTMRPCTQKESLEIQYRFYQDEERKISFVDFLKKQAQWGDPEREVERNQIIEKVSRVGYP